MFYSDNCSFFSYVLTLVFFLFFFSLLLCVYLISFAFEKKSIFQSTRIKRHRNQLEFSIRSWLTWDRCQPKVSWLLGSHEMGDAASRCGRKSVAIQRWGNVCFAVGQRNECGTMALPQFLKKKSKRKTRLYIANVVVVLCSRSLAKWTTPQSTCFGQLKKKEQTSL